MYSQVLADLDEVIKQAEEHLKRLKESRWLVASVAREMRRLAPDTVEEQLTNGEKPAELSKPRSPRLLIDKQEIVAEVLDACPPFPEKFELALPWGLLEARGYQIASNNPKLSVKQALDKLVLTGYVKVIESGDPVLYQRVTNDTPIRTGLFI